MTGLHVPGVNLHEPDVREQLRTALKEYDGDRRASNVTAVVTAARELLAELDADQGDEPEGHVCWVDDTLCPNCGGAR